MEQDQKPAPKYEIKPKTAADLIPTPIEIVRLNAQDMVDIFSRKIGHVSKYVHKSMVTAYAQCLRDVQTLLTAEKKK